MEGSYEKVVEREDYKDRGERCWLAFDLKKLKWKCSGKYPGENIFNKVNFSFTKFYLIQGKRASQDRDLQSKW